MGKSSKKVLFVMCFSMLSLSAFGENGEYPFKIPEGTSKTIFAELSDLYVINETQFDNTIAKFKELELCLEETETLNLKIENLEKQIEEKKAEIADLKSAYKRYVKLWEETDKRLEKSKISLQKCRSNRKFWAGGGFLAGAAVTIAIVLLVK